MSNKIWRVFFLVLWEISWIFAECFRKITPHFILHGVSARGEGVLRGLQSGADFTD